MKIVVFSDSHGKESRLERIVEAQSQVDCYIHLGDGYGDAEYLRLVYPSLPLLAVCGNCDRNCFDTDTKLITLARKRILYTHGHRYDVKQSMSSLMRAAREENADIVLFGHTHSPFYEIVDGIHFLNPGNVSAYDALRFATVDILDDGNIVCNLASLKN